MAQVIRLVPAPAAPVKKSRNPHILVDGRRIHYYQRPHGAYHGDFADPVTGKRVRPCLNVFTEEAARKEVENNYRSRVWHAENGVSYHVPTFAEVAQAFKADLDHKAAMKPSTKSAAEKTKHRIDTVLAPFFGSTAFNRIGEPEIAKFEKGRLADWEANRDTPLVVEVKRTVGERTRVTQHVKSRAFIKAPSSYTENRDRALLKRIGEFAVRHKMITANDAPQFEITEREEDVRGCFENWQFDKLIAHLKAFCTEGRTKYERVSRQRFYLYTLFHAHTGCRPGTETSDLTFGHFTLVEGGCTFPVNGKTGRRTVVGTPEVVRIVAALRALHDGTATNETRLWEASGYSHKMTDHLRRLGMTVDAEGLPLALYSLRHLYITRALYGGVAITDIADQCGTSVSQVERHYRHTLASLRGIGLMKSHMPALTI